MPKKSPKELINQMETDSESLLSESQDFPPEKASSSKGSKKMRYSKPPVNEKPKSTKEAENDEDDMFDISKTLQDFKNDFAKPINGKKAILAEFTGQVTEVYKTKASQLRKRQASEEKELRMKFMNEIDKELEKWKEDMNKVMEAEEEIVQLLQKHLKIMEKAKNSSSLRKKNLLKIAKVFEEQKEELVGKHENESGEALEAAKNDLLELQKKVITKIQKEDMAAIKHLFCSQMFG